MFQAGREVVTLFNEVEADACKGFNANSGSEGYAI